MAGEGRLESQVGRRPPRSPQVLILFQLAIIALASPQPSKGRRRIYILPSRKMRRESLSRSRIDMGCNATRKAISGSGAKSLQHLDRATLQCH